ncbi:cupin [Eggerthellaceae bacterium zg-997]|nr:cupin [Eggerthellaceae bacterium zg-997]
MPFVNLPVDAPAKLATLVGHRMGQQPTRCLTRDEDVDVRLLAFSCGEGLVDTRCAADTLYLVLEGMAQVTCGNRRVALCAGEVLRVPAKVAHSVTGEGGFKMLQIALGDACGPDGVFDAHGLGVLG